jgi:type IV pilus assembly protein PilF
MVRTRLIGLFSLGLLAGCVTVTDSPTPVFNAQEASDARIALGLNYIKNEQYQAAHENLIQAIKFTPNSHKAQNALAYYYQRVKAFDLAESMYQKALRDSPYNGDVKNNYGVFLCGQDRYDDGLAQFEIAVNLPNYYLIAASYENAALCSLKQGDTEQALTYFTKALDHQPYRSVSLLKRAELALAKKDFVVARQDALKYQRRYGYQSHSLSLLVDIEKQAGRLSQSIKYAALLKQHLSTSLLAKGVSKYD